MDNKDLAIPNSNTAKRRKKRFTFDDLELTILSLPSIAMLIIFSFLPMFGILIAFKNYQVAYSNFFEGLIKSPWCGFDNFKYLFSTSDAFIIIRNTVGYNIIFILLGIIIPVTLAIMMSELLNHIGAKIYQTSILLPYFLSWVVVSSFVYAFLAPGQGLLDNLSHVLGFSAVQWYSDAKVWPYLIVLFNVWKSAGYGTVIYLAAIAGIDKSLYEAAIMDGASKTQQARYITIPGIKPIIIILLILAVGGIFGGDIGLFYIIPRHSGPLYNVTEIIDTYVYGALSSTGSGTGNMGMSTAAAFFQSSVGCVMLIITNLIVRKIDKESSLF